MYFAVSMFLSRERERERERERDGSLNTSSLRSNFLEVVTPSFSRCSPLGNQKYNDKVLRPLIGGFSTLFFMALVIN